MEYFSVGRKASAEIEVKKSRFIASVAPALTAEEAEQHIFTVKRAYADARHNVYAYSIGTGTPLERLSDDGEPRGTAAYPILEIIKKRNLRNVVCVVTRYFGGTLLGAGGLLRAYGKAASSALDAAGVTRYVLHRVFTATIDYDQYGKLRKELDNKGARIIDTSYAERVTVKAYVIPKYAEELSVRVRDLTSGKGRSSIEEGTYIPWITKS